MMIQTKRLGTILMVAVLLFMHPLPDLLSAQVQTPGAERTAQAGALTSFTLESGMEVILFPLPDSASVLTGIVFRGGADAQTNKTAGLFRLLEHVLFRGTASTPGEPEPSGAMDALGTASLEGGAQTDRFGLSFLVSPDMLGQGLDTIVYLFSGLRLDTAFSDPLALEEARKSSLEEIGSVLSDPGKVFEAAMARKLFATAPWRLDSSGSEPILKAATEDSLRALSAAWLVPNNAVLILAGNFDPLTARPLIEKSFSSWKKAGDPWKTPQAVFPKPGVARPTLAVYPDPSVQPGEAYIEMRYRAPDAGSARSAAAELWAEMAAQPGSRLAMAVSKGMPKWSSPSGLGVRYELSRSASWLSVSARLVLDAKGSLPDSVFTFKEIVRGTEMYAMKTNAGYFTAKEYERAKSALLERRSALLADPQEAATVLADGWILGGSAWIKAWTDRIGKVTSKDIIAFADEYFMKNLEVVAVRLAPAEYTARKKGFDSYAFEQITAQKAFWWR